MAIDYILGVPCMPQKQLGIEQVVALHRTRILARTMLAHMRQDGERRTPSEITVQRMTVSTGGDASRGGVSLQDLIDESAALDQVSDHCKQCPAQLPREFACHRRIRYPIPERVEAWLMSRLPDSLACSAGALLVRALSEFGWDGAPTAKLRAAGATYFESRVPYGARWQAEDGSVIEISSDQVFQMMFMVGPLQPTHCMMLALFCGVIPHDTSLADLKDRRDEVLAQVMVPTIADPEIEQFAAFLRALAVAARLDLPILVDA